MVETRSVVRRRLEKEQEEQRESNARNLLRPWLSLNREGLLSWDEYKKLSSLNKFCWNQLVVFIQVQSFNYEEGMDLFCDLGRDHLKTRILNQARFLTPRWPRLSLRALQGLAFTASNLLCLDLYNTHVWMVSDLEQVLPSLTNLAVLYLGGVQFDGLRELEPKYLDVSGLKKLETVSLSPNVTHLVVTGVNHSIISLDTGSFRSSTHCEIVCSECADIVLPSSFSQASSEGRTHEAEVPSHIILQRERVPAIEARLWEVRLRVRLWEPIPILRVCNVYVNCAKMEFSVGFQIFTFSGDITANPSPRECDSWGKTGRHFFLHHSQQEHI